MKNLILSSLLLCATPFAFANSNLLGSTSTIKIAVPNGGTVSPMGGSLIVPIGGSIIYNVLYSVSCHVNNPNFPQPVTVKLSIHELFCPTLGGCGGYMVNGKYPTSNQVNLTLADNQVTFLKSMAINNDGGVVITDLDTTAGLTVSDCEATPST